MFANAHILIETILVYTKQKYPWSVIYVETRMRTRTLVIFGRGNIHVLFKEG